jgi:transcriptional regulator of arginine metabolism
MPSDRVTRELRREAILMILQRTEPIREQKELVELLTQVGLQATQSSVSRDLRDLGVYREGGQYHLPPETDVGHGLEELAKLLEEAATAGPFQILLTTQEDAAGRVARIIDNSQWPEVAGTLPSANNKVLVLTEGQSHQNRLMKRLGHFMA